MRLKKDSYKVAGQKASYKVCALIPTYNHHASLGYIVSALKAKGLDVILVDDGSGSKTQEVLAQLKMEEGVEVIHLDKNQGKGVAVCRGVMHAWASGYTHAFQIDADGQHDLAAVPRFLEASRRFPYKVICGWPLYDDSIPFLRRVGRWMTHIWVWVETSSLSVKESMCGFRIYPLEATMELLSKRKISPRMAFDTEILVRLIWQGAIVHMERVGVSYPQSNPSHFCMVRDNWGITKMHTKLVGDRLGQGLAFLCARFGCSQPPIKELHDLSHKEPSWEKIRERGSYGGGRLWAWLISFLGPKICFYISFPVVIYFYLTGFSARKASRDFWQHIFETKGIRGNCRQKHFLEQYLNFAQKFIDQVAAWRGDWQMPLDDTPGYRQLKGLLKRSQGGVFFVSHLGNIEVLRALYPRGGKKKIHVLMHTKNARTYHTIIGSFGTGAEENIIEVTELGSHTILELREKIHQGHWVIVAADRVGVGTKDHVIKVPFLGQEAPFPTGPHIFAALLECAVYALFSFKEKKTSRIFVENLSKKIHISRNQRNECLKKSVTNYVKFLEKYTLLYPHQWYNFYNYWNN